jgi:hypothetical protein
MRSQVVASASRLNKPENLRTREKPMYDIALIICLLLVALSFIRAERQFAYLVKLIEEKKENREQ